MPKETAEIGVKVLRKDSVYKLFVPTSTIKLFIATSRHHTVNTNDIQTNSGGKIPAIRGKTNSQHRPVMSIRTSARTGQESGYSDF
jgi:hypothetical protein